METTNIEELIKKIIIEKLQGKEETPQVVQEQKKAKYPSGTFETVDEAICAAKNAQQKFADEPLLTRKKVVGAIRKAFLPLIEEIAKRTVEETGMGVYEDKVVKNRLVLTNTPGVEDLYTEVQTGDGGMTLYELSPYGVIGSIAPSTNPTETLIGNSIGMLAAGNAVFFSPHPGARNVSQWVISKLNEVVNETCGINNLVVTVANPTIEAAQEMMTHKDVNLLVVTGGPGVVSQAMRTGKKVIGAGPGNPPSIVDETANIEKAASDIVKGASFDNNILCIAEKSVVAVDSIADLLIFNMEKNGALLIKNKEDIQKLEKVAVAGGEHPNKKMVGKDATVLLDEAGIPYTFKPRLIICETTKDHPFAKVELMMPILPIVRVPDFDCALETALELEGGLHHTATMHSQNISRLNRAAKAFQTSIFVKNGPSYAGVGVDSEGTTTFTIATPTGEGTTSARHFARRRRCVLLDGFSIR